MVSSFLRVLRFPDRGVIPGVAWDGRRGNKLTKSTGCAHLRDTFVNALLESNVGVRTQVVGLAVAAVSTSTGAFGTLGSMLGSRAMGMLYKELRSFVYFYGLKWAATNLQTLWLTFCASSTVIKSAFLRFMLQRKEDGSGPKAKAKGDVDDDLKRIQWARKTLEHIAARIPQFPIEAVVPELAVVLKAWDLEKESGGEALEEWIKIDVNDESSIFSDIKRQKNGGKAASSSTANVADQPAVGDSSYRRSPAVNAAFLEQVARETFVRSGMNEEQMIAALAGMGLGERHRQAWAMEVEELDSDVEEKDDDFEVVDLGHV